MEDAFRFALLTLYEANQAICADDAGRARPPAHRPPGAGASWPTRAFRRSVLGLVADPVIRAWWSGYFDRLDRQLQMEIINPVQTKVAALRRPAGCARHRRPAALDDRPVWLAVGRRDRRREHGQAVDVCVDARSGARSARGRARGHGLVARTPRRGDWTRRRADRSPCMPRCSRRTGTLSSATTWLRAVARGQARSRRTFVARRTRGARRGARPASPPRTAGVPAAVPPDLGLPVDALDGSPTRRRQALHDALADLARYSARDLVGPGVAARNRRGDRGGGCAVGLTDGLVDRRPDLATRSRTIRIRSARSRSATRS